jgi:3-oxoacyl-[acyl-carrier protein] reductase
MGISQSLKGHRALICGASAGIGRATALCLAEAGAETILLARREDRLLDLQKEIQEIGGTATLLVGDLDKLEDVLYKVDRILKDGNITILINNTGGPKGGSILKANPSEFLSAFSRHLISAHSLMQRLLPGMIQSGYGRIVNVLSTSVYEPIPNLGVSNTTRGAVASWSKSVSKELPPGITINNILPGFTDTERLGTLKNARASRTGVSTDDVHATWLSQVPEGRLARPEETATAIAFLVSPAAAYIRGLSLPVDGGRLKSI